MLFWFLIGSNFNSALLRENKLMEKTVTISVFRVQQLNSERKREMRARKVWNLKSLMATRVKSWSSLNSVDFYLTIGAGLVRPTFFSSIPRNVHDERIKWCVRERERLAGSVLAKCSGSLAASGLAKKWTTLYGGGERTFSLALLFLPANASFQFSVIFVEHTCSPTGIRALLNPHPALFLFFFCQHVQSMDGRNFRQTFLLSPFSLFLSPALCTSCSLLRYAPLCRSYILISHFVYVFHFFSVPCPPREHGAVKVFPFPRAHHDYYHCDRYFYYYYYYFYRHGHNHCYIMAWDPSHTSDRWIKFPKCLQQSDFLIRFSFVYHRDEIFTPLSPSLALVFFH